MFDCELDSLHDVRAIDLLFLLDTTASMNCYFTEVTKIIRKIICDIEKCISQYFLEEIDILKVGLVTYRDHEDEGISYLTNIEYDFATNIKEMIKHLMTINCNGGKDEPEAVFDGLKVAVNDINWRKDSIKFIYHILDAPCHGKKYNSIEDDKYEECPEGIDIGELLNEMRNKNIKYTVIKLNDSIDIMLKEFQKYINIDVVSPKITLDETKIKKQD